MSGNDETPVQSELPTKEETPKTKEEIQEEATTFLTTGKRHLLVNDVPAAVTAMSQACELLSKMFGETAIECAEAYYLYGKALLELSRLESGVLGNALDGVPEEEDEGNSSKVEDPSKLTDEEKNDVDEKVREALEENFVDLEKKVADKSEENKSTKGDVEAVAKKEDGEGSDEDKKDGEKSEAKEVKETEAKEGDEKAEELNGGDADNDDMEEGGDSLDANESKEEMETEEVDDGDLKDKEVSEKNDEEPSNLQLAWEKREALPKDSRLVVEAQYQLGVALGLNKQNEEAVKSLNSAILGVALGLNKQYDEAVKSLNSTTQKLKEIIQNMKNEEKSSEMEKKEAEELEALISETEALISEDMKKESEAKEKGGEVGLEVTASGKGDVEAVSIAVKRKAEGDDSVNKKVAVDEQTAGAS